MCLECIQPFDFSGNIYKECNAANPKECIYHRNIKPTERPSRSNLHPSVFWNCFAKQLRFPRPWCPQGIWEALAGLDPAAACSSRVFSSIKPSSNIYINNQPEKMYLHTAAGVHEKEVENIDKTSIHTCVCTHAYLHIYLYIHIWVYRIYTCVHIYL